jgi:TPR repeat protein
MRTGSVDVLQVCSRCHSITYCSQRCQAADWPKHELICGPLGARLTEIRHKGKCSNPAESDFIRGLRFEFGWGVAQSIDKAMTWYRKAATAGHIVAQYNLAVCLAAAGDLASDTAAFSWFRNAAEEGCSAAQRELAACFERGRGVPKDVLQAAHWLECAAAPGSDGGAGDPEAQFLLGAALLSSCGGLGEDKQRAQHWLRGAALQGHIKAQTLIASDPSASCGLGSQSLVTFAAATANAE